MTFLLDPLMWFTNFETSMFLGINPTYSRCITSMDRFYLLMYYIGFFNYIMEELAYSLLLFCYWFCGGACFFGPSFADICFGVLLNTMNVIIFFPLKYIPIPLSVLPLSDFLHLIHLLPMLLLSSAEIQRFPSPPLTCSGSRCCRNRRCQHPGLPWVVEVCSLFWSEFLYTKSEGI